MARKRKREKTKIVTFRASEKDYERWKQKADELGITLSELITTALNKKRFSVKRLHPELVREIARIGNNLNQLTRAVNIAAKNAQPIEPTIDLDRLSGEVYLIRLALAQLLEKK